MDSSRPKRLAIPISTPMAAALLVVGLSVGGLVLGRAPNGADPDLLYRPIKSELARSLRAGTLPFWSDRFGIGVPLVAESHAAAFYPPNWVLYRLLDVRTAYRLAMWLNYLAIAAATFAYARALGVTPWGAAVSSVSFSLCGFQANHAGHEPFYYALPYLPLCLLLAHRYAERGGWGKLALLALAWGAQITIGHFQVPMWTGGLVVVTGTWRVVAGGAPWRRIAGLAVAIAWGLAIALVQLAMTRELTELAGFSRSFMHLLTFCLPPGHLMQPAFPAVLAGLGDVQEQGYWSRRMTTPIESGVYLGTLPLILACVGWVATAHGKDGVRAMAPWRSIVVLSLILATLPGTWPDLYRLIVEIPILGWFRASGRYTLLATLGMALLAGHGLDRTLSSRRFGAGLALAAVVGLASAAWIVAWMQQEDVLLMVDGRSLRIRLGLSAISWGVAIAALLFWRRGRIGGAVPLVLASIELAILYQFATVDYAWWPPRVDESPTLARLDREPHVGLIGGKMGDLVVSNGRTVAFPYLGITAPPPNYLLAPADDPKRFKTPADLIWLRRFGVTHGVYPDDVATFGLDVLYRGPDPTLDVLLNDASGHLEPRIWKLVAYPEPFPAAWTSTREEVTRNGGERGWAQIYSQLSVFPTVDEAWYEFGEPLPPMTIPFARSARVRSWDGKEAVVDHDGACVLVVRRAYYKGWSYRVDDGPWRPVSKVDAGLQGVRLDRVGPSRVRFRYEPTGFRRYALVSIAATASALLVVAVTTVRRRRSGASSPG